MVSHAWNRNLRVLTKVRMSPAHNYYKKNTSLLYICIYVASNFVGCKIEVSVSEYSDQSIVLPSAACSVEYWTAQNSVMRSTGLFSSPEVQSNLERVTITRNHKETQYDELNYMHALMQLYEPVCVCVCVHGCVHD